MTISERRGPHRRGLLAAAGAALLPGLLAAGRARADGPPAPDRQVAAGPKTLALTFDDGPSPLHTPRVLDVLDRYDVPATFFVLGANVAAYPDVTRLIAGRGHALGNHTWAHPDLGTLSRARIRDEIVRTQDVVADATGRVPALFRAPGGHFVTAALEICADLRLRAVSWSVDPEDWSRPGVDHIVRTVLDGARTGAIVLHHDGSLVDPEGQNQQAERDPKTDRSQTVEALKTYLPRLLDAGYRFTTVPPLPRAVRGSSFG
ncbi:polysaccharide deacetylase family protein [Streptomyces sp. I05A-00742]|uniref:polysaccharide deacetylase family protein n=1 Tax=Streptomyces sp. I05A-00742 TaxID=2732853 RepID=UPI002897BD02|nr:polysaccharide deacetylase family protein [Streptomyces sp. I05A-00742]